jgi:glycosyltransferase involved in cell wall biosynthesis
MFQLSLQALHVGVSARGVDTAVFRPDANARLAAVARWPRPILLYVGRVAVEKNIEAFLELRMAGTKIVVGGGPALTDLKRRYPDAVFQGYRFGAQLAAELAGADVLVFPSRTDTFGIVMLEAMACGVPVAAFPVHGPLDVVRDGEAGVLHEQLHKAIEGALQLDAAPCRAFAQLHSWERCTRQFLGHLAALSEHPAPARSAKRARAAVAELE